MASSAAQVAWNNGWHRSTPHLVSSGRRFGPWEANTFMGALSAAAILELESVMSAREYDAGEILFLEQEPLSRVFIVISGDMRLSIQDIDGRRLTLHIARRGDVLGMGSALYGSLSEWSADALYPSRLGLISRDQFHRFAERHPEVHRIASQQLVQTLGYACETLRIVGLTSCVRRKLASQLLAWGRHGCTSGDQTQFRMTLTHAQIAEFIGAVRETVRAGAKIDHVAPRERRGVAE